MTIDPSPVSSTSSSAGSLLSTNWKGSTWPEAEREGETFRLFVDHPSLTRLPAGSCDLCLSCYMPTSGGRSFWYPWMLRSLNPDGSIVLLANEYADAQEATATMDQQYSSSLPAFAPSSSFGYNENGHDWCTLVIGSKGYGAIPAGKLGALPIDLKKGETMDLSTGAPQNLVSEILGFGSEPGDVVLDPFANSHSIGRTCIIEGRRYVGILRSEAEMDKVASKLEKAEALL